MNLKFYTSVVIVLKLKVRKFWGLISAFVEVVGEKPFCPHPILNMVKFQPYVTCLCLYHFVVVLVFCNENLYAYQKNCKKKKKGKGSSLKKVVDIRRILTARRFLKVKLCMKLFPILQRP